MRRTTTLCEALRYTQWLKWKMDIGGSQFFSRAPSPYLRAPRNSTGPLIFLTGPIAGLILRILMDSTYFLSWRNSRPADIFSTQNTLFPFRAELATGGGVQIKIFHTPKAFFPGLCQSSGYHLPTAQRKWNENITKILFYFCYILSF